MPATRRIAVIPIAAILAIAVLSALAWTRPAHAAGATIVVNTLNDEDTLNSSCSLREAIYAADGNADHNGCIGSGSYGVNDTIDFNVGTGTPTISIGTRPLPHITQWVTIDGHTGGADRIELHGPGGAPTFAADGLIVAIDGFGTTIRHLVINNFQDDGIYIAADEVTVQGSFIGTDKSGTVLEGNDGFGVQVIGGNGAVIGGTNSGGSCTGDCNVISGNYKAGVLVDISATGTIVRGNFIGTDVSGTVAVANQLGGIEVKGGATIGGDTSASSCTGTCNLISGNGSQGVLLDAGASSPTVRGNFIGTNVTSSAALSNATGIEADGDNVTVGGADPKDTNVISGNRDNGILDKGSITALGNYIGTDRSGVAAIPNGFGINVATGGVATIGGTASGVRNLISGNGTGILARGNITVLGNFIGTNISGTAAIANVYGINVSTGATGTIGGAVSGAGNLISGNSIGIELQGAGGITIQGNMIGTQANGTSPLGNTATGGGIAVEAQSNNVIGGTAAGEANVIAFNGNGVFMRYTSTHNSIKGNSIHDNLADGVYIEYAEAIDNTISRDSIYKNGTAGIDLADGANAGILPPVIAFASSSGASGTACANCTIEVFSDSDGQGRNFEGSVTAAGAGNWTFNGSISGPDVTATATDTAGNTSEFSQPFNIVSTSTPSPTPTGTAFIWGDNDCSGVVAGADALLDLLYSAGIQTASISSGNAVDCTVGQSRAVGPATWGDVDCSGVIDPEDATDILAYIGGVPRPTPSGCPAIGSILSPS